MLELICKKVMCNNWIKEYSASRKYSQQFTFSTLLHVFQKGLYSYFSSIIFHNDKVEYFFFIGLHQYNNVHVVVLLKDELLPNQIQSALEQVIKMSLYIAAFIFPSILTSIPVPAAEKHSQSMMLPPPWFTVGMVFVRWWAVAGFLQTWNLAFWPKS